MSGYQKDRPADPPPPPPPPPRRIAPKVDGLLDIGSPYDGRKRSLVVSPAASIVACAAGLPVVMHGEKGLGPKHGVPVGDVLGGLGVDVGAEPAGGGRGTAGAASAVTA